jgi:Family of unknown function (DUF5686)/CarboxypepD_reg-like domain
MKQILLLPILFFLVTASFAATVSGIVKDAKGNVLPFSSLLVKGSGQGSSANIKGVYSIVLGAGSYTLVCQHVGFKTIEKKIKVGQEDIELNFELEEQQYTLKDVVVQKGEDPAFEIIRNAIKKRPDYFKEIKKFDCEVYIKGDLQLRDYPKKFFGQKVDFEDGDTAKRKILFLSETIAKYSVEEPNNRKVEVISTKVSGNSDGFGFASPQIISLYSNVVTIGSSLNPRGFISPIANNALNYYKYKFEGTYYENGKEISRIKVIPKRKYEPLFSGYINIMEDSWRINSVDLMIVKEQQMQFLDTLKLEQIYMPLQDKWVIKQQVIYPAGKFFSFDFFGNFLQIYDKYNIEPSFAKKFFNNTILKIYDSANKKTMGYWDSVRPIPLLAAEKKDYKKKDSLEQVRKDPKYLDSLDKKSNKVSLVGILLTGESFSKRRKKETITLDPIVSWINYNTVEGTMVNFSPNYFRSYKDRQSLSLSPNIRYGFDNQHFNAHLTGSYTFGKKYFHSVSFSGGKRVFQFNNNQPINADHNTYATKNWERNYMKIYEANFFKVGYATGLGDGFNVSSNLEFQDRMPLENLPNPKSWRNIEGRDFTPNYPTEIASSNMIANKAASISIGISWRPGSKYIEIGERKISIGSKYPTFNLLVKQGINGLMGSTVDYTKWNFSISDNLNMKLGGRISYRLAASGFLNANNVYLPDYQHYNGNRIFLASPYLSSFQLMPYYKYSNTEKLATTAHVEYHLNGLITNKIPLLKKWNWFFVLGGNALYINDNKNYYEAFFSIENIFKVARIDFIQNFEPNKQQSSGIRLNIPFFKGRSED